MNESQAVEQGLTLYQKAQGLAITTDWLEKDNNEKYFI